MQMGKTGDRTADLQDDCSTTHTAIYRAPGASSEVLISRFLSDLVLKTDKIIIVGDFNIHVDNTNDSLSLAFISVLDSIGFSQCVHNILIVVTTHLTFYYHTV